MSYKDFEESRAFGQPITLILFQYGPQPDQVYGYTDSEFEQTYNGVTYRPVPIKHSGVVSSGTLDKSEMTITIDGTTEIAQFYNAFPPGQSVPVYIYEMHSQDTALQVVPVWVGRVLSSSRRGYSADLTCEPIQAAMRRAGLRRLYGTQCPHLLFSPKCGASKEAAKVVTTVSAVSNRAIQLVSGWLADPTRINQYIYGTVEWTSDNIPYVRTILRIGANKLDLYLSGPATGLESGSSINVFRGCDHSMTGCNLHSNIKNYGGQPFLPTANPIGTSTPIYY